MRIEPESDVGADIVGYRGGLASGRGRNAGVGKFYIFWGRLAKSVGKFYIVILLETFLP
jgi:hypothetical protein